MVVHHSECTSCGDLEIDSGAVVVPPQLRNALLQHYQRVFGNSFANWEKNWQDRKYIVGNVRIDSDSTFDAMYLLPGRTRTDTIYNQYGIINPWDFHRCYRVTGHVVGIRGLYLLFHVDKAMLLRKRIDY